MVFTKHLHEGIRRGRITCSVRIWMRPQVKVGGRYRFDAGHIVIDSIAAIDRSQITEDLARQSGFNSLQQLLETASHGKGDNVYLIRFHYLRPGAWEQPNTGPASADTPARTLLQRIRTSRPAKRPGNTTQPAKRRGQKR